MAPSFGSMKYWNERFHREPEVFEWLREPTVFRATIIAALTAARARQSDRNVSPTEPEPVLGTKPAKKDLTRGSANLVSRSRPPPNAGFDNAAAGTTPDAVANAAADASTGSSAPAPSSASLFRPQILHIGCGTSALPFYLRQLVDDPAQVNNTDFSRVAIEIGKDVERAVMAVERGDDDDKNADENDANNANDDNDTVASTRLQKRTSEQEQIQMRWTTLNLLSFPEMKALLADGCSSSAASQIPGDGDAKKYHIILDKSTSDAIACSDDVRVTLPHFLEASSGTPASTADVAESSFSYCYPSDDRPSPSSSPLSSPASSRSPSPPPAVLSGLDPASVSAPASRSAQHKSFLKATIHPLHVLALHLAYVTAPGGRWIALSYSQDRFPFLAPYPAKIDGRLCRSVVEAGLPHPARLWKLLERRDLVPTEDEDGENEAEEREVEGLDEVGDGTGTEKGKVGKHAPVPAIKHTLYVLERTAVAIRERGAIGL